MGLLGLACATDQPNAIEAVEISLMRGCEAWAVQVFESPSSDRDEAFIECIVKRDPSVTTNELRHRLATGDGDGLFERLMSGTDLANTSEVDCPYLRVAVQSPAGSDEAEQQPMRQLFSKALVRAGFQVVDADTMHHWWATSLTLDTGPNSTAWTILVRATPEIGNGAIQFTSVEKTVNGRAGSFSGVQSLRAFAKNQAPEAARLAAEGIAKDLLPAAYRRCGDIDASLEEARVRVERLRDELAKEIQRVRREKARREEATRHKQLEIEVEG